MKRCNLQILTPYSNFHSDGKCEKHKGGKITFIKTFDSLSTIYVQNTSCHNFLQFSNKANANQEQKNLFKYIKVEGQNLIYLMNNFAHIRIKKVVLELEIGKFMSLNILNGFQLIFREMNKNSDDSGLISFFLYYFTER